MTCTHTVQRIQPGVLYQGLSSVFECPWCKIDALTASIDRLMSDKARLAVELGAEKMAHSVTIAEEHESRTAFQERIRELEVALDRYALNPPWDRVREMEAALRQTRPYVYHTEVADAADLEARYSVLSVIDGLLTPLETPAKPLYRSKYEMPDGGYVYAESQAEADLKVTAAQSDRASETKGEQG